MLKWIVNFYLTNTTTTKCTNTKGGVYYFKNRNVCHIPISEYLGLN